MSKSTTTVCYLWSAEQAEPGLNGCRYAVTATKTAPEAIKHVPAGEGLVHAESLYSDWNLMGVVSGEAAKDAYGEDIVIMRTPAMDGTPMDLSEVVRAGYYTQASVSSITYVATIQTMGEADGVEADRYVAAVDAALRARFPGALVSVSRNDRLSGSVVQTSDDLDPNEVRQVANNVWDRAEF